MMNRSLDDIMKMNNTYEVLDFDRHHLSELVNNYNELREKTVSKFALISNTVDGIDAKIDGIDKKILIEEKDSKVVVLSELNSIKNGSLIEFYNKDNEEEHYLVTGRIIDKIDYLQAEVKLCNQIINLKGVACAIPCVFEYYDKEIDEGKISEYSSFARIKVKKTNETKNIKLKTRFIFNHSKEEIFEVVDINATEFSGLYEYLVLKVPFMEGDDLVNNIGYSYENSNSISLPNESEEKIPIIYGKDTIKIGTQEVYFINDEGINFELIDNSSAEIISQDGTSCTIVGKKFKKNTIIASRDNIILTRKNILID